MNPNTIPWEHYQDLQINDLTLKRQFDEDISAGRYTEALELLRNHKEGLKGKAYVSKAINTILSGVLTLQSFFNDGVNVFLSDLAVFYMQLIENFNKKGIWNANIDYTPYNFVVYNDDIYMNIKDGGIGILPTDSTYWLKLDLKGEDGAYSVDLIMQYQWSNIKQYEKNDIVVYDGNLYVALKSNKNAVPAISTSNWLLFISVEKGGIIVSDVTPNMSNVSQNTVWFKTDENAITSTVKTSGQFYRYIGREWEEMYPSVLFNWINNADKYAPILKSKELKIAKNEWKYLNGMYYYSYEDNDIKNNSYINILPNFDSEDYKSVYNTLKAEYGIGTIKFYVKNKPIYDLIINIKIQ